MKLEVIATSLEDIALINQSDADRIEFCWDLEVGGLTPSYEAIKAVDQTSKIPVNVMVRPHQNGYVYSEMEFAQILKDIDYIAATEVAGIVIGILTTDNKIDYERLKLVVEHAKGKQVTFHRAFQEVVNQLEALKELHKIGVQTVLTSGKENINQSLAWLEVLKRQNQVVILAGGGVNQANLHAVQKVADQIHVGTAVRVDETWASPISVAKINAIKNQLVKK